MKKNHIDTLEREHVHKKVNTDIDPIQEGRKHFQEKLSLTIGLGKMTTKGM